MAKYVFGSLVVFAASALWLLLAWSIGNRTHSWTPTLAEVVSRDVSRTARGRPAGWLTTISYDAHGTQYEAVLDEYLLGREVTVYVDPENPRAVVGTPGARIQELGQPIIATVGSGLFVIVLLLIAASPKDD